MNNTNINLTLLDPVLEKFKDLEGSLIVILQKTQDIFGYLPMEAMEYIANNTNNSKAQIYGVATFYHQFRLDPVGKYLVLQCEGTACHVNSSKDVAKAIRDELGLKESGTTEDMLFTLEEVACLGCCSLAPVVMINDETHGNLTPKKAASLIKKIKKEEETNNVN